MKRALILYPHGLGDIIQLTPHLRHLYGEGYITDLMCMSQTASSKLLDNCPYTDKLIDVPNNWKSPLGFDDQIRETMGLFEQLRKQYDWSGVSNHVGIGSHNKIDFTSKELGLTIKDKHLEVFISDAVEKYTLKYVKKTYPKGYIFVHTFIEEHAYHNWDAKEWIKDTFPNLPVVDTGYGGVHYKWADNINATFVLMREASHRVLSSSVMVHACEAMGVTMDVVNYGRPDRKVWPACQELVLRIREKEQWIKI